MSTCDKPAFFDFDDSDDVLEIGGIDGGELFDVCAMTFRKSGQLYRKLRIRWELTGERQLYPEVSTSFPLSLILDCVADDLSAFTGAKPAVTILDHPAEIAEWFRQLESAVENNGNPESSRKVAVIDPAAIRAGLRN